jgi:glycosyltransferase involved in cell wall biosynthesis
VKILFTSTLITPFIQEDLNFLQKHFKTRYLRTTGLSTIFLMKLELLRSSLSFTWFASVYAGILVFLGRMFRRPSVVVVGGVDVANRPDAGYGIWVNPWKRYFARYALRYASKVLVVDPFLAEEAIKRAQYDGANIECVPTGYDSERWKATGNKQKTVVTVAACLTRERLKVKGVDFLFEVANELPEIEFTLIGVARDLIHGDIPKNVRIVGLVPQDQLLGYFQQAKVYCQPSMVEGLPNAVCEAMLCECIPVATDVGGTKRAVGSSGFLVEYRERRKMKEALVKALDSPLTLGASARQHVAQQFPLSKRHESLLRVIQEVLR